MSFTLKDIKGALVEKKMKVESHALCGRVCCCDEEVFEFNRAIDAQSSVKLRFNRETLAVLIWKQNKDVLSHWNIQMCEEVADAIIAADKDIVEVDA